MAALVTLPVAKAHLKVFHHDEDADIERKADQASDIILSYLKGRRLDVEEVTSTAGVATVTTRGVHGLATDDVVALFGMAEPEYNGAFEVTVTSTTTFTVPITGEPASPATGVIGLTVPRGWTDATAPLRVQAAVLMVLGHLYKFRGDVDMAPDEALWKSIERVLAQDRTPAMA